MPRKLNYHEHGQMLAAKAALHGLPVVPNGVPEVSIRTFSAVAIAGQQFAREQPNLTRREAQRIDQAVMWIAYRCTDISTTQLANSMGKSQGTICLQLRSFNQLLADGETNKIVDDILQILVRRGDAKLGVNRLPPAKSAIRPVKKAKPEQSAEISLADHRMAEVLRLRKLKWSINGIAKRTGVPLDDVARACGVELQERP